MTTPTIDAAGWVAIIASVSAAVTAGISAWKSRDNGKKLDEVGVKVDGAKTAADAKLDRLEQEVKMLRERNAEQSQDAAVLASKAGPPSS